MLSDTDIIEAVLFHSDIRDNDEISGAWNRIKNVYVEALKPSHNTLRDAIALLRKYAYGDIREFFARNEFLLQLSNIEQLHP